MTGSSYPYSQEDPVGALAGNLKGALLNPGCSHYEVESNTGYMGLKSKTRSSLGRQMDNALQQTALKNPNPDGIGGRRPFPGSVGETVHV